jgi:hypothetical protein
MSSKGHAKQDIVINTTEATLATSSASLQAHQFIVTPNDFTGGGLPKVSAWKSGGLGAIVITLWERVGDNWNQVFKAASAVELSATNPQEALTSYGTYALAKASAVTGVECTTTKQN